jgi:hypothetical protein
MAHKALKAQTFFFAAYGTQREVKGTANLSLTQNPRICGVQTLRGRIVNWRFQNRLTGTCEEKQPSGRRDIFV